MDTLETAHGLSSRQRKLASSKVSDGISKTVVPLEAATSKSVAKGMKEGAGEKVRTLLRARLGEDIFSSWFKTLEIESFSDGVVKTTVPVKFLCSWIQSHYADDLLECCKAEFKDAVRVEVSLRQPGDGNKQKPAPANDSQHHQNIENSGGAAPHTGGSDRAISVQTFLPQAGRTQIGGFEGSPLDPRYTFESFVVGASNRMAHAGATQVAETVLGENSGFNPLYIHSSVGLGKTHLLHAIAWEVKRRAPQAKVLYLTAERFRYQFVEAMQSNDPMRFKEKFRTIDILLIDDLEFLHGDKTEQEFDHIINSLLDGGRQIVVASARAPRHVDRLNERMRSRLQRGLVSEIGVLDLELRRQVLEKRLA